ncbi:baculoviral IAP repeat-containing protein 2 isoform X2 [Patella vulgata]|uniref:baculoviral IAP repeat-containing protein 2 isoform X2 n=1 Tax=Patella vulgata TaxID=6465 RepID=UPI00217FEABD|nr:baculoviral IAP repeat-containing protein 2 isoform X2 [Patella vulgata]
MYETNLCLYFQQMSRERSTHIFEGCMVYEWQRLATFANWSFYNHGRPITLAEFGFYYTGNRDIVRCYSCGVEKGQWSVKSNPMLEHRQLNPWCLHLNGEDMRNVPVYSATQNQSAFPIYRQRNPSPLLHDQCTSDVFYPGGMQLHPTAENLHVTENRQPTPDNHVFRPEFMDARQCTSSMYPIAENLHVTENRQATLDSHVFRPEFMDARQCTLSIYPTAENLHVTENRQPTPANHVYHPEFMDARQCTSSRRVWNCRDEYNIRSGDDRRNTHRDQNSVVEEYDEGRVVSNRRNYVMCCICKDRPPEVQFLPCSHLICCGVCAETVRLCPNCRSVIRETIPVVDV